MKVFCIFSDERAFRSRSPGMHNRVLGLSRIDGVYVPFCVRPEGIGDAVRGFRALGIAGANVTVPYKEAVVPHLDVLENEAKALRAVNTIVRKGDRLEGHNTDVRGFLDALRGAGFDPDGRTALVFGTGGAARAVVYALHELGRARVVVIGRDLEKAVRLTNELGGEPMAREDLVRVLSCVGQAASHRASSAALPSPLAPGGRGNGEGEWELPSPLSANLVVNATSVSSPNEAPDMADLADRLMIRGIELVVDINYGRSDNIWRSLANRHGARFVDGLPMLAYQARRSFELWTGVDVDPAEFLRALEEGT